MNKQQVLDFWIIFSKTFSLAPLKKLFLFGILGILSGALGTYVFNFQVLDTAEMECLARGNNFNYSRSGLSSFRFITRMGLL